MKSKEKLYLIKHDNSYKSPISTRTTDSTPKTQKNYSKLVSDDSVREPRDGALLILVYLILFERLVIRISVDDVVDGLLRRGLVSQSLIVVGVTRSSRARA